MGDGAERRQRKPFEPPPWEREQFERLARRRAEEADPVEAQRPRPVQPLPDAEEEPTRPERGETGSARTSGMPDAGERAVRPAGDERAEAGESGVPAGFEEMLADLAAEEKPAGDAGAAIGSWAGLVVAVLGFVLMVWAVIGLRQAEGKPLAATLAAALLSMGALFAAAGVWLARKSLKRQGVL